MSSRRLSSLKVRSTVASGLSLKRSILKGMIPHSRFIFLRTASVSVKAKMGQEGRHRDSRLAMYPRLVNTKIADAFSWFERYVALAQIPSLMYSASDRLALASAPAPFCPSVREYSLSSMSVASLCWSSWYACMKCSVRVATVRRTSSDFIGCRPAADSPLSMSASARCCTTSAMSATSARVGVGCSSIDLSRCEATMQGLFRRRHVRVISCCTTGTSSSGIWAPRSPRATITASLAATISSRLGSESKLSILDTTEGTAAAALAARASAPEAAPAFGRHLDLR
mmetsp:Transcript_11223/g.23600  ORF Transcript_11223/g.23600 Transcript_11223/m.23600 type:complete len:284 (+) Transcript_11223:331-1182(+)